MALHLGTRFGWTNRGVRVDNLPLAAFVCGMNTCTLALLDGLGGPELLVIALVVLLLFGSKRMPEIGRGVGRAIREFKRATSSVEENIREVFYEDAARPKIRPPAQHRPARTAGAALPPAATAAASTTTSEPASAATTPRAPDHNEPAPLETPDFAGDAERPQPESPRVEGSSDRA